MEKETQPQYIERIPEDDRLTTYPIMRSEIWEFVKKAQHSFWTAEEVSLSTDRVHYERKLSKGQKWFVDCVLAFFAASDKIVNMNLAKRFKDDINIPEVEYFYNFQIAMEDIHAEMYSLQLETIIPDKMERQHLLNAITTIPVIGKMTDWMFSCISSSESFPARLLRMACVEGVFFSGCFCAIYWLQNKGLMPGLGQANELIARDEGLHTQFALALYNMVKPEYKLSKKQVYDIFDAAVNIAREFINYALPESLPEMNATLMSKYIECMADNLLALVDLPPLYKSKNPFPFMEQLNLANRTNFFERRVSEYSKPNKSDKDEWERADEF